MDDDFFGEDDYSGNVDLTPLLDAVFILIIFFAIAATFSKPVLDVILPESETAEEISVSEGEIAISINRKGEIIFDGKKYTEKNISTLMNKDRKKAIYLYIDEEAPFKSFLIVLDSSRKEGRDNVYISTEKKR